MEDHQTVCVNNTGGLKIWQISRDEWSYGPVLRHGKPCIAGVFTFPEVKKKIENIQLIPIGYEYCSSIDGIVTNTYMSVYPVSKKNPFPTTDVWQNIVGNMAGAKEQSDGLHRRYAQYLTASLRSLDFCIAAMANHYHNQLVSSLREGRPEGQRYSHISDLSFAANVHSFFLHFGSARDYLATLVARRCGIQSKEVDSLASLAKRLHPSRLPDDPLLRHLLNSGLLVPDVDGKKMQAGGWLKGASALRNSVVHNHPYGSREPEQAGMILSIDGAKETFKYWRPIMVDGEGDRDALDVATKVYHNTMHLFGWLAEKSGLKPDIRTLDDTSIVDIKFKVGKAKLS